MNPSPDSYVEGSAFIIAWMYSPPMGSGGGGGMTRETHSTGWGGTQVKVLAGNTLWEPAGSCLRAQLAIYYVKYLFVSWV